MRTLALCSCLAFATLTQAAPGDYWHVNQWSTNVRLGPGTDHPISRQLGQGDVVMELARDGDWLYVALDREGRTGWLYQPLASPLSGADTGHADTPYSRLFRSMLVDAMEESRRAGEQPLFNGAQYLGYATVSVAVTEAFLQLTRDAQFAYLEALQRLWQTMDNTGIPTTLILQDEDGARLVVHSATRGVHWFTD